MDLMPVSRKRKFASEAKERAEPLHGILAGGREESNTRSKFQNASADILIEIFLQAISTKDALQGDDYGEIIRFNPQFTRQGWAKMAPVNVSGVCQRWRVVALSSPSLWSTFFGCGRTYKRNVTSFPWEYLDVFLLRSKNAPFNLIINMGYGFDMGYDRLLAAFNNNLARLKTVDIECGWSASSACSKAWHIELADMPLLETFRLLNPNSRSGPHAHIHLADTPVLRRLSLTMNSVLHHDGPLVFQNLTHISLSGRIDVSRPEKSMDMEPAIMGISWHVCLLMMQASPSIKVFSAKEVINHRHEGAMPSDDGQMQSYTVLSKLSTLDLEFEYDDEYSRHLLDNLCLPSLTELSLKATEGAGPPCGLQALLSRSEPVIRKLDVCGIDGEEVIQCLERMPTLQTFSISSSTLFEPEFISRLTLTQNTRVCPKLEDIRFYKCGDPSEYSDELSEMICSRWDQSTAEGERCFKSVTFEDCSGSLGYPYSDQLLEACREGLVIRVGTRIINPDDYRATYRCASDDEWHGSMSGPPSELEEYWAYNTSD